MVERYRQLVNPAMPDTGLVDGGGQALSEQLARAAKGVQNAAYEFGSGLRMQQGEAAGAKAGKDAKPISGFGALTPYGRAYNGAAEVSYSNAMQIDIAESMDRIDDEHEGDVVGWSMAAEGYKQGLLESVPEAYRPRVNDLLGARMAASGSRVRRQEDARFRNETLATYMESVPVRARMAIDSAAALPRDAGDALITDAVRENDAQVMAMVQDRIIDPTAAVKLKQDFANALDTELGDVRISDAVETLMNTARNSVEAGDAALGDLSRFELTPEEEGKVRAQYQTERNLLQFERTRQHAEESSNLSARLASGEAGQSVLGEAHRLYDLGAISVDEYQSAKATIAKNAKAAAEKAAASQEFDRLSSVGFDPGNTQDRKAVSTRFDEEIAKAGYPIGSQQYQQFALGVVSQTGILPSGAESWARVNLISGDPNAKALAASFFHKVRDASPMAWDYNRDPKLVAYADQVADSVAAGVLPEQAVEKADSMLTMDEARKKDLESRYNREKVYENDKGKLQNLLNSDDRFDQSWTSGAPPPDQQAQDEYSRLVKTFYMLNDGDATKAREQAGRAFLSAGYGYSKVNGKPEVLKYAPEVMRPWLPVEAIREDVAATLKEQGVEADPAKVELGPIGVTEATKGARWGLFTTDEYGNVDQVRGPDNRPIVYELPGQDAAKAYNEKYAAQKEAEARAQREQFLRDNPNAGKPSSIEQMSRDYAKSQEGPVPAYGTIGAKSGLTPRKPLPPAKDRPLIGSQYKKKAGQ